jgi:hypothetical protein
MEFMENVLFAIGGLLAAILAAWLSAKWSVRKFYSEKWWERKEKAYAEIIEALYDVLQYCEIKKEDYGNNQRYGEDKMVLDYRAFNLRQSGFVDDFCFGP